MKHWYLKLKLVLLFVAGSITAFAQYTASNLETGNQNTAVARDTQGNIYTMRTKAGAPGFYEIAKYTNGEGTPTIVYSNVVGDATDLPYGLAIASNGDIYFSSQLAFPQNGKITRLDANNNFTPTVVQSSRYFTGLAFDNQDRLYALEYNQADTKYAVVRYNSPSTISPSSTTTTGTTLNKSIISGSGLSYPTSISVASDLTIYCNNAFDIDDSDGEDKGKGGIIKFTTVNGGSSYTRTDLNTTNETSTLYLDEFNNLYAIEKVAPLTTYRIQKYTNGTGTPAQFYDADFASVYPILAYGITAYSNTVYAIDGDNGSSGSRLLKLTPIDLTPPAVPTGLQAPSFSGGSKVNLSWNANSEPDFNGYRIYYGTTNNPASLTQYASVSKGNTTTQITGLIPGTQYYFVISSLDNNFNESAKSSSVSITPQKPVITSATYAADTKTLTVTGTNFLTLNGATNDILVSKLTIRGEDNITRALLGSSNVELTNTTSFSVVLHATDQAIINPIINKNGTTSTGGATYNLAVATDWAAGEDASVNTAQATIPLTVSNVATPTVTSALYNGQTGVLAVTGANLYRLTGSTNDIDATKFTFTGDNNSTYTLTSTPNVDITNGTSFNLTLSNSDKVALANILNKNGTTSSISNTNYNLAVTGNWNRGAEANANDETGNSITVSNYVNYVLPIELIDFSHRITNNTVVLNWSTSSETNNKEFRLSRSANGTDFTPLTTVIGAGNSSVALSYSFTDRKPLTGISYYKLTQVDNDNTIKLEREIPVNFSVSGLDVVIYPNPVSESFNIQNNNNRYTKATLSDLSGKILGSYTLSSDVTSINVSKLPKGVYMLNLSNSSGKVVKKIVKN